MAVSDYDNCEATYHWKWEKAFEKFGFGDGDGQVETYQVEAVLTEAGYEVEVNQWRLHNTVISSIKKDGNELIPFEDCTHGYDDPKDYLPEKIIQLLDKEFPEE